MFAYIHLKSQAVIHIAYGVQNHGSYLITHNVQNVLKSVCLKHKNYQVFLSLLQFIHIFDQPANRFSHSPSTLCFSLCGFIGFHRLQTNIIHHHTFALRAFYRSLFALYSINTNTLLNMEIVAEAKIGNKRHQQNITTVSFVQKANCCDENAF